MKKYQQLEKLFGRKLYASDLGNLAAILGQSINCLDEDFSDDTHIQSFSNATIRSVISDKEIDTKSFEARWQEFVLHRQEAIKTSNSLGCVQADGELRALLNVVSEKMDKELVRDLDEAVTNFKIASTYLHYNKGYLDGIKFALMAEDL